jgi:hypothetical protein
VSEDFHDLEELRRLSAHFQRLAGPPGLFHVARVRLDGSAYAAASLEKDWDEFLPGASFFEFHVMEARAGPDLQQGCYRGAREKLEDYTQLAAAALGMFPVGTAPVTDYHRSARADRDAWTLALYGAAGFLDWQIAVDALGSGPYARFRVDPRDALLAAQGRLERGRHLRLLQTLEAATRKSELQPPRHVYLALATDLFTASYHFVEHQIGRIARGEFAPKDTVLLPHRVRFVPPAKSRGSGPAENGPAGNAAFAAPATPAAPAPPAAPDRPNDPDGDAQPWPPDDGWYFRPGEYAFMGQVHTLRGKLWEMLSAFAKAKQPLTRSRLNAALWGDAKRSNSNFNSILSTLRTKLRKDFDLQEDDPIPQVEKEPRAAWRLDVDLLRRSAAKKLSAEPKAP